MSRKALARSAPQALGLSNLQPQLIANEMTSRSSAWPKTRPRAGGRHAAAKVPAPQSRFEMAQQPADIDELTVSRPPSSPPPPGW
jgi:hypothetical protein